MISPLTWLCCQLGAREHYLVPAALKRRQVLDQLVTDIWIHPGNPAGMVAPRLRDRFHPGLDGSVAAFNRSALLFEARQRARRTSGWSRMIARNDWFQSEALTVLERAHGDRRAICAYSYAARRLFEYAKTRGWRTVLMQIDPGPAEEQLVGALHAAHPGAEPGWSPAPPEYWQRWRREIDLADRVVVHSSWSRDALARAGVAPGKLVVIPLAYEPPPESAAIDRGYPTRFTAERPLRVLFLGQINLRKGAVEVLEASIAVKEEPIEFVLAGPRFVRNPDVAENVHWIDAVPRTQTASLYQHADVFLFPTKSDGFGLTQLEALAWRLPVIATPFCGDVVEDGVNGVRLANGTAAEIVAVLRELVANPDRLGLMSRAARVGEQHRADHFAARLQESVH